MKSLFNLLSRATVRLRDGAATKRRQAQALRVSSSTSGSSTSSSSTSDAACAS